MGIEDSLNVFSMTYSPRSLSASLSLNPSNICFCKVLPRVSSSKMPFLRRRASISFASAASFSEFLGNS